MNIYLRYFLGAIIVQVVVMGLALLLGLGDIVLLFYMVPLSVLDAFIDIPNDFGQRYGVFGLIFLITIPALIYSLIFALIFGFVKKRKNR